MGFFDDVSRRVKHKAVEWDVQGKAEKVAAEIDKVAHEAKDKAAELADENRGKIRENLDKAGAKGGVDKLAEQRPGGPTPPGTAPPGSPSSGGYASGAAGGAAAGTYTPEPYRPDPIDLPEPIDDPPSGTGWPQDQGPRP